MDGFKPIYLTPFFLISFALTATYAFVGTIFLAKYDDDIHGGRCDNEHIWGVVLMNVLLIGLYCATFWIDMWLCIMGILPLVSAIATAILALPSLGCCCWSIAEYAIIDGDCVDTVREGQSQLYDFFVFTAILNMICLALFIFTPLFALCKKGEDK
eukprot:TRINITY_DN111_c4_g3_i1.p1 TRINITY_DN111_c4_g3~~TRINITY_DN111_c4_g3_i1.p1  ORF type:complete len:156 (-),score=68.64 TRINITY_DN111_c4_g3_i1:160-627(-)